MRIHTPTAADTEALGAPPRAQPPGRPARMRRWCTCRASSAAARPRWRAASCSALGVTGPVRSPTYTLVELYPAAGITLVHADLYRLRDPAELESLGLREWAAPGHLWLVEWPEKGGARLPAPDLALSLSIGSSGHDVELAAPGSLGQAWLARLQATARASPG